MKFSVKDFFSKCVEILNGKLHLLCSEGTGNEECITFTLLAKSLVLTIFYGQIRVNYTNLLQSSFPKER